VFGIGLGEILLIVLVTFLVAPKEIPIVLRKLGQFFAMLGKLRDEVMDVRRDVEGIVQDAIPDELRRNLGKASGRGRPPASPRTQVPARRPAVARPVPPRKKVDRGGGTRGMRGDGI
jgi:Sec-independent protein translocase protein TatA